MKNGVNVVQSDLERGLSGFEDGSFDYVVLSQTLQAMRNSEIIMREMLRVGREGIVTFPNFGYWKNRLEVLQGRMPVSRTCPTSGSTRPNVHLCTMTDFEGLCVKMGAEILDERVIHGGRPVTLLPNLLGQPRGVPLPALRALSSAEFLSGAGSNRPEEQQHAGHQRHI